MRAILLTCTIFFTLSLFLIASNFSVDTGTPETAMRSIDLSDLPTKQNKVLTLHETEIGKQYIMPYKKLIPNSQWEETHILLEATISEDKIKKNISYDYYSEMPKPLTRVRVLPTLVTKTPKGTEPQLLRVFRSKRNKVAETAKLKLLSKMFEVMYSLSSVV